MDKNTRQILESPLYQGVDEQIAYRLTTTPWGSSPGSPVVKLYKVSDGSDVSASCLSGAASAVGDVITTPKVQNLAEGESYRLEIKFTISGNVMEAWALIHGEQ